jgi:hypothetical protein
MILILKNLNKKIKNVIHLRPLPKSYPILCKNSTENATKGDMLFYFKLSKLFSYINTEIAENTFIKIRKILVCICKIIVICR